MTSREQEKIIFKYVDDPYERIYRTILCIPVEEEIPNIPENIEQIMEYIYSVIGRDKYTKVFKMRLMDRNTYSAIAEELNLSIDRIRQIYDKMLRMIRNPMRSKHLQGFPIPIVDEDINLNMYDYIYKLSLTNNETVGTRYLPRSVEVLDDKDIRDGIIYVISQLSDSEIELLKMKGSNASNTDIESSLGITVSEINNCIHRLQRKFLGKYLSYITKGLEATENLTRNPNLEEVYIKDIGLSTRAFNAIVRRRNFGAYSNTTLKDIKELSFDDLLNIRNMGLMSAMEIVNAVRKFGIIIEIPEYYQRKYNELIKNESNEKGE